VSESSLSRYAGQIALATGAGFALVDLARLACQRSGDLLAMMADPSFRLANAAYFVAFVGLAVGLIALHERLAPRIGRFGLAAFLVALAGTMTQGGNMWFDGFAGPWLAEVAPQAIDSEKTITLVVGAACRVRPVRAGLDAVRHRSPGHRQLGDARRAEDPDPQPRHPVPPSPFRSWRQPHRSVGRIR
jgi:hypothetical protein